MKKDFFIIILLFFCLQSIAQIPPVWSGNEKVRLTNTFVTQYIYPSAIAWRSDTSQILIQNEAVLLKRSNGQSSLVDTNTCKLKSTPTKTASILLDFGKELFGGIRIITGMYEGGLPATIRVRFGESYSEAMSELKGKSNATNDHAIRDFTTILPWLGAAEIGNTGFRFVRIDLLDTSKTLLLKEISAAFKFRDVPYLGSFRSSDTLLNKIWDIGAYTVHLNMQNYLWDGIKRDQLAWMGDLSLETKTLFSVFGKNEIVPQTLDLIRDETPLPQWMNTLSSFSLWWPYIQYNLYMQNGDLNYLKQQEKYLTGLVNMMVGYIKDNGEENLPARFFDWPTSPNEKGVHAGLQSLMIVSLESSSKVFGYLRNSPMKMLCDKAITKLRTYIPDPNKSLQAAAMMGLAGLQKPIYINDTYFKGTDYNHISPFMGYHILQNKALAGDYHSSLDFIRFYWGAMLKLGATTFWEDLQTEDLPNAAGIDKAVPAGKLDIHGDCGEYCYLGLRHSLCHGWASGPTPWLSEHVLGVKILAPGCTVVKIEPHLGDLQFAEGSYPTPYGIIKIKHTKLANGKIKSVVSAPKQIKILQ